MKRFWWFPLQVLEHFKYVNFTTPNGIKVFFDESGDSATRYDMVNWQIQEDGSVEIVTIGQYDNLFPDGEKFKLKDDVKFVWGGNSPEVRKIIVLVYSDHNHFSI